jgi:Tfp pilus assembly protein PilV
MNTGYALRRTTAARQSCPLPQTGFSYIEAVVTMFIIAIAIGPAVDALRAGVQGNVYAELHIIALMESKLLCEVY